MFLPSPAERTLAAHPAPLDPVSSRRKDLPHQAARLRPPSRSWFMVSGPVLRHAKEDFHEEILAS
jgi:hypothetical protein